MTDVRVVPEGEEPMEETVTPQEAALGPQSPLALLRAKRETLSAALHIDLAVPRSEEMFGRKLWVRYSPSSPTTAAAAQRRREQSHLAKKRQGIPEGDPDWEIKALADVLVDACIAVYDLAVDEMPPKELPDNLPTFSDPALSEAIGAPPNAVSTVRKVYATDGDLQMAHMQLVVWSGQASEEADADFLGR